MLPFNWSNEIHAFLDNFQSMRRMLNNDLNERLFISLRSACGMYAGSHFIIEIR